MNGADHVLANPDFAFSYMATTVFNPIIGLLFLIAGLSAIMSSADSDAIAGVTTFLTDIYVLIFNRHVKDEDIPKYSRIFISDYSCFCICNDNLCYGCYELY